MNQFVTILLALVMIMSGLGEAVPATEPVSCEVSIEVAGDGNLKDAFGLDDKTGASLDAVKSLLGGLKFKAAMDNSIQQMQILLNEKDLFNLYMKKTENELRVISSMMPNTEITIAKETLDAMKSQMNGFRVDSQELSLFIEEIKNKADELLNDFIAKQGEVEYGSYEIQRKKYAEKRPIKTTSKEAFVMFAGYIKDIYENESLSKFVEQLNIKLDKHEFEESYNELIKMDEDAFPQMLADYYKNADNDDCIVISLEMNEKEKADVTIVREDCIKEFYINMNLTTGYTEGTNYGKAGLPSVSTLLPGESSGNSHAEKKTYNMDIYAKQDPEKGDYIEFIVHTEKGDVRIVAETVTADDGKNANITVTIPGQDGKNAEIKIVVKTGKDAPVYNKLDELTEIPLEDILKEMNNQNSANDPNGKLTKFANDINDGLNELLTVLQQEAPDFMNLVKTK